MSKLLSLRIDLNKIDKSKIYQGEKGKYLTMTVSVNDEPDTYGNNVAAWIEQNQEERQNKSPKQYLGNGKVFWSNEATEKAKNIEVVGATYIDENEEDLPF